MLTKIKKSFLIALVIAATLLATPMTTVMAADPPNPGNGCTLKDAKPTNAFSFFPAWYDGLACANGNIVSPGDSSLGGTGSDSGARLGTWLTIIAMNIVRMLLYAVGYASLIFIIWGGFKFMTQSDNSSGTTAARKTIQNAVIGLIISLMSVSIVTFVSTKVAETGSGGACPTSSQAANASTSSQTTVKITSDSLHLNNAPCSIQSDTIGGLLNIAYLVAGIVAVISMVFAGIRYATANGDSSQIQNAKNLMFYSLVGLVVIIGASAVTQFIITQVTK
jgi:hypothetical protein